MDISRFTVPGPLGHYAFSHIINNFGARNWPFPIDTGRKLNVHKAFGWLSRCLLNVLCTFNLRPVPTGLLNFRKADIAKIIIICENNYLLTIFAQCAIIDVWQGSEYPRVLNIPLLWISQGSAYVSGSVYARVLKILNVLGLYRVLGMSEYFLL